MAGMSVDGLVSGMDTTNLINSLVQAEAAPQTALKTRLTATQAMATAYRTVNTRFDALRSAAELLSKPETWTAGKATSNATSVTVTVGTDPRVGSLTFAVQSVAATHSVRSADPTWTGIDAPYGQTSIAVRDGNGNPVLNADGTPKPPIAVPPPGTLAAAVSAINASSYGLTAAAVRVDATTNQYRLQVTANASGAAAAFQLGDPNSFLVTTPGADATITVGTGAAAYDVVSATNDFTGVLPGATFSVTKPETSVTAGVVADPDAVAAKVQGLVDAVNGALNAIKTYSTKAGGATAVLKGDSAMRTLSAKVLDSVSAAVGTDGSAGAAGLQLTRDGTVVFDKTKFVAALKADPAKTQRLFSGGGTPAVAGVGQRLSELGTDATDTTTGILTQLANGRDAAAKDIQTRIEAWDLRLALRKAALTRQFSGMETALSSLRSQSNWLAGQIASLPSTG